MLIKMVENRNSRALERAMDFSMMRAELLVNNIANVNTPEFKRSDLDFSAILQDTLAENELPLAKTNRQHFQNMASGITKPRIITETGTAGRYDGNNVDVEFEMAQISENTIYFQSLSTMWKKEMERMRLAIQGR